MSYTDSILTEDYANKFNELLPQNQSKLSSHLYYKSDIDQDSIFTDEMENFKSKSLEFDDRDTFNVERKYQEILKKRRRRGTNYQLPSSSVPKFQTPISQFQTSVSNYSTPTLQFEPSAPQYKTSTANFQQNYKYLDDHSSGLPDYSLEIRHKKNEVQRDLERERLRNRSKSPDLRQTNFREIRSPRETLERKVVELDQLSTIVKRTTAEHQQLCKDLQEMQNELRKHQAEVRLSERIAIDNSERIELVNTELRNAEMRRDQTLRNLNLVNEELALKQAKLRSFDQQISREMANIRRMEQYGIDKNEIEKILAERDELYQIVKRQEDIKTEKYELAKQLDMMREDMHSEQEKSSRHIENLEDELECSLGKIKQLQFEKDDLEAHLEHLRHHLSVAEDEACKSSREVSELRDDYQIRIREKLEEYEIDKERVEKELKKLEDEKSMDEAKLKGHIETLKKELLITEKERKESREIVAELEEHLRRSVQSRCQILEEHEFKIKQLVNEKEEALQKQKKEASNEYRTQLEETKSQHRHEKNELQKQCNEEIDALVRKLQAKDKENAELFDRLQDTERNLNVQLQKEKTRFDSLLQKERIHSEECNKRKMQTEINKLRDEYEANSKSAQSQIDQQASVLRDRNSEIAALKKEICSIRSNTEKMIADYEKAAIKIKDDVKQETTKKLKARYEEKMDDELVKVKSDLDKKLSSKLSKLTKQKKIIQDNENKTKELLSKIVRTVVYEINGECNKMASLLNVSPRKVDYSKLPSDLSKADNVITQAIANLEACGSETRSLLEELEIKIKSLNDNISLNEKELQKQIRSIRFQLESQKLKDVSEIREKLLVEYLKEIKRLAKSPDIGLENLLREKEREITKLHLDQQSWKERAAEKLAEKFDQYSQKKINELRNSLSKKEAEIRQLKTGRGRSSSPIRRDRRIISALALENKDRTLQSVPASVIADLQDNLDNLRKENFDLRKNIIGSKAFGRKSRLEKEIRHNSLNRVR